jgi:HEAT repeat protein
MVVRILCDRNALPKAFLLHKAAQLEDDDDVVRTTAMKRLRTQNILPDEVVSHTTARLNNHSPEVQMCAIKVLSSQTALSEASLLQVAKLLRHEAITVRLAAIEMLCARAALPETILTHIVALLNDKQVLVRVQVLAALGKRDQPSEATVKQILARLQDRESAVRIAAVQTLRSTKALYSNDSRSQIAAQLEKVNGSKSFMSDIVAHLRGTNSENKLTALGALADDSMLPEPILVHIATCLDDPALGVCFASRDAFIRQAALSEMILTEIAKHFEDSDTFVRQHALAAIHGRPHLPRRIVSQVAAQLEVSNSMAQWTATDILIRQAKLSGRDIMPHGKSLFRQFASNPQDDTCWITTPSESYLQNGQKRTPIYDWVPQMDIEIREIAAELQIPQPTSVNPIVYDVEA